MVLSEYTWIFAVGIIVAFIAAFGIGANDLANSFGSSVGTKAITMWQAVMIAAVCEFCGAFLLGAGVTDTIKGGIAKTSSFEDMPAIFLYGFFAVLIAAALWDNLACHLELPVSTTHTTVGAVIGFALVAGGGDAVIWYQSKDEFPYFSGFTSIVVSWFLSPICAGIVVAIIYFFMRTFILRSKHSFMLSFWLLPLFTGALGGLLIGFIIQVGAKNGTWAKHSDGWVAWVSACFAVGIALFTLAVVMPLLKRKALKEESNLQARIQQLEQARAASATQAKGVDAADVVSAGKESPASGNSQDGAVAIDVEGQKKTAAMTDEDLVARALADLDAANHAEPGWTDKVAKNYHEWVKDSAWGQAVFENRVAKGLTHSLFYDVHEAVREDDRVAHIWSNAEVFDFKTERLYRYLQVFSAMAMSFAHGSNDVANAMGPLTAIYQTWNTGAVPGKKSTVPKWILALGGVGIVCGLATYGYKIMRVLGVKSVKLTNVRGFVCEWSTALVVCIASRYGLPISTTQVISGAIMSVGLWEGRKGVNWSVALKMILAWMFTCIISGSVCALVTALGVFTPNKNSVNNAYDAMQTLNAQSMAQIQSLNTTSNAQSNEIASLNATLTEQYAPAVNIDEVATFQTEVFNVYNTTMLSA